MAGTYGHETEHLETSRTIYHQSWHLQVPPDGPRRLGLVATGFSCRSQVKRFDGFRPKHPAQALLTELLRQPLTAGSTAPQAELAS